jgi:hypothetical protein
MGAFNFIETFFFISLGITFVLILLLVYHVKQRLSTLEQKSDTMFEIINNIVKEFTVVKNMSIRQYQPQELQLQQLPHPSLNNVHPGMSMFGIHNPEFNMKIPQSNLSGFCTYQNGNQNGNQNGQEDEEDEEDSDDEDDEEDDEDDEDDEEEDQDEEDEDEDEEDEDDEDDDETTSNNIKIINLNQNEQNLESLLIQASELTNLNITAELLETELDIESMLETTNQLDVTNNESRQNSSDSVPSSDDSAVMVKSPIQVNKIDDADITNLSSLSNSVAVDSKNIMKDVYRKMSIQALKALVVSKGLATDTSKLKKNELIALLETANE